jgi:hypothetical protein
MAGQSKAIVYEKSDNICLRGYLNVTQPPWPIIMAGQSEAIISFQFTTLVDTTAFGANLQGQPIFTPFHFMDVLHPK